MFEVVREGSGSGPALTAQGCRALVREGSFPGVADRDPQPPRQEQAHEIREVLDQVSGDAVRCSRATAASTWRPIRKTPPWLDIRGLTFPVQNLRRAADKVPSRR